MSAQYVLCRYRAASSLVARPFTVIPNDKWRSFYDDTRVVWGVSLTGSPSKFDKRCNITRSPLWLLGN